MARTRALYAPPNALSLSRMRYLGAVSQGNDSVIWRASHSAVGYSVSKSQQPSALMAKDETYEEPPKGNRWNDKQVNGCYLFP
jgi:hypothetical protein